MQLISILHLELGKLVLEVPVVFLRAPTFFVILLELVYLLVQGTLLPLLNLVLGSLRLLHRTIPIKDRVNDGLNSPERTVMCLLFL